MDIKTIGIIGAGRMGAGIAQVMAASGFEIILMDIKDEFIRRGIDNIKKGLAKALEKGKITPEEKEKAITKIRTTKRFEDMEEADFIIEAVPEIAELKIDIFKRLEAICHKEVILSTNTSSIPISKIASVTKRQDKVIGMHFMNHAPVMELVEVVRGINTSDETFLIVKNLAENIGKIPVESKDSPGFIVNRVLMPMINEAVFALMEGVATAEDIDKETKNPKHMPCPLIKRYVDEGHLGKKTGRGFYKYEF